MRSNVLTKTYDLIVFSHLRWNSVFQRPQQLISRIAATNRVFFIEEPIYDSEAAPSLEITSPTRNLFVCQPHTPIAEPGFGNQQIEILGDVLEHFVREHRIGSHVAWLYTPMAAPLLSCLSPDVVVYDCMDALDSFLNAPAALKQREQDLLNRADLLFTGGPSLYRRLEARHHAVHCFPSSVDANHFGKATQVDEPADQSSLPHPRLGFFGVIDERCGLNLLEAVATRRPEWQIIMIGPIAKIDDAKLPRRPNLHYLGKRDYELLPHYVAGWDVCLMPFAINEATRFISPTKVLEYMAAERPIVSTRITDVADPYGHIVSIADTEDEFIAACEAALHESEEAKQHRTTAMRRVVSGTSWD